MNAVEVFMQEGRLELLIPQYVIAEAAKALMQAHCIVAAIRLIRGAYRKDGDGGWATLEEAKTILALICK